MDFYRRATYPVSYTHLDVYKRQPLGPTSYGDSPYQSFSAFAGNPYYIDLQLLTEQGLSLIHI